MRGEQNIIIIAIAFSGFLPGSPRHKPVLNRQSGSTTVVLSLLWAMFPVQLPFSIFSLVTNKKFWEKLIAYFP
jgi:hypothetical protein